MEACACSSERPRPKVHRDVPGVIAFLKNVSLEADMRFWHSVAVGGAKVCFEQTGIGAMIVLEIAPIHWIDLQVPGGIRLAIRGRGHILVVNPGWTGRVDLRRFLAGRH